MLFQEVAGEAVLLDLADERYFGLDEVGTRIWKPIQERGSLRAVYETMLGEIDVAPTRLEEDLLKHVAELADPGLVVVNESAATTP